MILIFLLEFEIEWQNLASKAKIVPHCSKLAEWELKKKNKQTNKKQQNVINGSQLAKMKKSIPDMSLPLTLWGWSSWSRKLQICLKNHDFCEYVKIAAISWKFDILSIIA